MTITKVEMLVMALDNSANADRTQRGEIITIQPAGAPWGTGDLTGRFVFCVDLELPCRSAIEWKTRRCSKCEYTDTVWDTIPPVYGTFGVQRTGCDVQGFEMAKGLTFEYVKGKTLEGKEVPIIITRMDHKSGSKVNYAVNSPVSSGTISIVEAEVGKELISVEEKDIRLLGAREYKIFKTDIESV